MTSQAQKQKQGLRWGSLLSGAVAGLESRLDTILAEDDQASARHRAAEQEAKEQVASQTTAAKAASEQTPSRTNSRSRANGRLQDRLAKAMVKGQDSQRPPSRQPSEIPRPTESPQPTTETGRASIDSKQSERAADTSAGLRDGEEKRPAEQQPAEDTAISLEKSTPAPTSELALPVPSVQRRSEDSVDSQPPRDHSTPQVHITSEQDAEGSSAQPEPKTSSQLEGELLALRNLHEETVKEQKAEHTSFLERIDALQSKLTYLANTLSSYTSGGSSSLEESGVDQKIAEKDAKIAALMDEGQNLSKTELKHMNLIKKLRAKITENDRDATIVKQKLAKVEEEVVDVRDRAKRAEASERAAQEKLTVVTKIERDVETLRSERESAGVTIAELRKQLVQAEARAKEAEKTARSGQLESRNKAIQRLEEELTDMKIEKKLAEDRAKSEIKDVKEESARLAEKAKTAEVELKGEIAHLETKLELLRSQTEETTTNSSSSTKLLRQVETLQTQYALASENWQGIETTLTSRVAALEKERDDITKRESDARRKARDVNVKVRRLEDELESMTERANSLELDVADEKAQREKLQSRLAQSEKRLQESHENHEREKKVWEAELAQKIEEEKIKWRIEASNQPQTQPPTPATQYFLRGESPSGSLSNRKVLHADTTMIHGRRARGVHNPHETTLASPEPPSSRRSSVFPPPTRQDSTPSLSLMNGNQRASRTPSINPIEDDDAFDTMSSPQRTIGDMISAGLTSTGPSIQLVERLSTNVRRLESEKAASKEEMARLTAQRDEAREEVVNLMREVDGKGASDERIAQLEKELEETNQRYQTTLEMYGEKSEQVEELQNDVADLKKIYRDLVSTMK